MTRGLQPFTLRALSVQQPWAWAILHAGKDVENRTWWRPDAVGPVAIHASKVIDVEAYAFLMRLGIEPPLPIEMHLGAVVGVVEVTGGHNSRWCLQPWPNPDGSLVRCSRWAVGSAEGAHPQIHWQLANPRPVDPIGCRGALGLWQLPRLVQTSLLTQVNR